MQIKHQVFLQVDFNTLDIKHFLQGDTIIIDGHNQAFSKYSKQQICNIFKASQKRSYEWSSPFACR